MTDAEFIKACEQDAAENTQPEGTRIYDYGDRVCVVTRCERWAGYQHTRSGMCPRWEFTYHGRLYQLEHIDELRHRVTQRLPSSERRSRSTNLISAVRGGVLEQGDVQG